LRKKDEALVFLPLEIRHVSRPELVDVHQDGVVLFIERQLSRRRLIKDGAFGELAPVLGKCLVP
jgi:hypothetical protein